MVFHNPLKNEKSSNIYFGSIKNPNAKTAIIFIHGLVGSRRYWNKTYQNLSQKYSLYFIDLLGFGFSAKPKANYILETHIKALKKFVDKEVEEDTVILVGHSLGAIIALSYTSTYLQKVERAYLLALPYYHSEEEAKEHIKLTTFPSYFVVDTIWLKILCNTFCYFGGPISRRVVPIFAHGLPKETISDSFLHTYNSYISTLYNVLYKQNIPSLLPDKVRKKLVLIHGEQDKTVPIQNVRELARNYKLELVVLSNQGHKFPIDKAGEITKILNTD